MDSLALDMIYYPENGPIFNIVSNQKIHQCIHTVHKLIGDVQIFGNIILGPCWYTFVGLGLGLYKERSIYKIPKEWTAF